MTMNNTTNPLKGAIEKYEKYVANINWHIKTNDIKGEDLKNCQARINDYKEVLHDLKALTPSKESNTDWQHPTPLEIIKNMRDKNFREEVILEEVEKALQKTANTDCSVEQAAKDYVDNQVQNPEYFDILPDTSPKDLNQYCERCFIAGAKWSSQLKPVDCSADGWISREDVIAFGKSCFYSGYSKCESDDANCYTAWREAGQELITTFIPPPNTEQLKQNDVK